MRNTLISNSCIISTAFEHYDIVHFANTSFGIAADKKAGLTIVFLGICFVGVVSVMKWSIVPCKLGEGYCFGYRCF